jgi:hypothetical protein
VPGNASKTLIRKRITTLSKIHKNINYFEEKVKMKRKLNENSSEEETQKGGEGRNRIHVQSKLEQIQINDELHALNDLVVGVADQISLEKDIIKQVL